MVRAGLFVLLLALAAELLALSVGSDSEHALIKEVAESGQCADLSQDPDSRVLPLRAIAPGPPPVLSFRYYEGKLHHRFENADLMLDDAGH